MRGFILTTLLAGIMFAATALQPVSNGKIEQIPASEFENVKKTFKTLKKVTDSKGRAIVADIPLDPLTLRPMKSFSMRSMATKQC